MQRSPTVCVKGEDLPDPMSFDRINLEPLINHAVTVGWRAKPAPLLDEGDLSAQSSLADLLPFIFRKNPLDVEKHPTLRCIVQGTLDKEDFYASPIDLLHENEEMR
jgi:hypothetical protein